jgi:probable HAF family extracellular repeat protein
MTDLGTLGGNYSEAYSISDNGIIVGRSKTSTGAERAFRYSGSTMVNLGTLSGSGFSAARGVNSSGDVVGYSSASGGVTHAFLYSGSTLYDLNTLASGFLSNGISAGFLSLDNAFSINDLGYIVGTGTYYDGWNVTTSSFVLSYY